MTHVEDLAAEAYDWLLEQPSSTRRSVEDLADELGMIPGSGAFRRVVATANIMAAIDGLTICYPTGEFAGRDAGHIWLSRIQEEIQPVLYHQVMTWNGLERRIRPTLAAAEANHPTGMDAVFTRLVRIKMDGIDESVAATRRESAELRRQLEEMQRHINGRRTA